MTTQLDVRCFRCGKEPHEIEEYLPGFAWEAGDFESPAAYCAKEEGTYNPENGHFACTDCYIALGQPSSPEGWKAP